MMLFFDLFNKKKIIDYDFCLNLKPSQYPKYLMKIFEQKIGYRFNLKKTKTLNEIIQYLKIYDNLPIKATLTDKTKSGFFVEQALSTTKYSKEVYGVYNSILDVDFNMLPDKFMIKQNNACKYNIAVLDKKIFLEKMKDRVIDFFPSKRKNQLCFCFRF